jgi:MSHA biogenesis protein MshJ
VKEQLTRLATRIDALTLRERVLLFAAVAAGYVFLMHFFGLGPMFAQQERLRTRIVQQQNHLEGIDNEIRDKVLAAQVDPDAPTRARIAEVRGQLDGLATSLRAMQNGLVPPERMAPLVEAILRANGRLQMVSMRTLPVEPVMGTAAAAAPASAPVPAAAAGDAAPAPGAMVQLAANLASLQPQALQPQAQPQATLRPAAARAPLLYRHGVEVTVRGNYLDMIGYMAALESMPTQLFWGRAQLEAETWPNSRLTLTLYTLSLDAKWMKL